jgi:O-succinylbenzoate synthase
VAVSGAADIVVIKVAPLGGVRAALDVAYRLGADHGLPVVVSSALDTSVGLATGVRLAAALPELPFACGLGTAALLAGDVTLTPLVAQQGWIEVSSVLADRQLLHRHAVDPVRRAWWHERLGRVHAVLTEQHRRSVRSTRPG